MWKNHIGEMVNIWETMNINQSIDSGFAITHHGDFEGRPLTAISAYRGDGDCCNILDERQCCPSADLMRAKSARVNVKVLE